MNYGLIVLDLLYMLMVTSHTLTHAHTRTHTHTCTLTHTHTHSKTYCCIILHARNVFNLGGFNRDV